MSEKYDVAIIGAGLVGVWTALNLQRSGLLCILLDKHQPFHADCASASQTRAGHGLYDGAVYRSFADQALSIYNQMISGCHVPTGAMLLGFLDAKDGPAFARHVYHTAPERFSLLDKSRLADRHSDLQTDFACYDAQGGVFLCPVINQHMLKELAASSVVVRGQSEVQKIISEDKNCIVQLQDDIIICNKVVIAAGVESLNILKRSGHVILPGRDLIAHYPAALHYCYTGADQPAPPFAVIESGFFHIPPVLPDYPYGKIGVFTNGFTDKDQMASGLEILAERYIRDFSQQTRFVETPYDKCAYDMSHDEHFVVGPCLNDERIILGCGFNGTGYKFVPVIAQMLQSSILDDNSYPVPDEWKASRLFGAG